MSAKKPVVRLDGIQDSAVRSAIQALMTFMRVGDGQIGDPNEAYLKRGDLSKDGILRVISQGIASSGGSGSGGGGAAPVVDLTAPDAPENVVVVGSYSHVFVQWDATSDPRVGFAEVFRHTSDNRSAATLVGVTQGALYMDADVLRGATYYYWVRHVNRWSTTESWIVSPFNAISGSPGAAALDPVALLDALTDKITSGELYQGLKEQQTLKTVTEDDVVYIAGVGAMGTTVDYDGSVHRGAVFLVENFAVGAPGSESLTLAIDTENARVVMDGAFIKTATIRDAAIETLSVEKLIGDRAAFIQGNFNELKSTNFNEVGRTGFQLSVNGAHKIFGGAGSEVVANEIRSNNYVSGLSGFRLAADGFFEARNAYVRGDVEATSIKADAANVVSTLHLQGNAITTNAAAQVNYTFPSANSYFSVITVTFDFSGANIGQPVVGFVSLITESEAPAHFFNGRGTSIQWRVQLNGVEVARSGDLTLVASVDQEELGSRIKRRERHIAQFFAPVGPGIHTFTLVARHTVPLVMGDSSVVGSVQGNIVVVGGKK